MLELRVPFAVDNDDQLHSPASARRGRNYFCPSCREPVILKQGEVRAAHFAHKVCDTCNQESIVHKTAKLLIQKAVHDWKAGVSKSPELQRRCQICNSLASQSLPEKVDRAVLEHRLSDCSIVDVALVGGETALAAVEIRVTHAVGEMKAQRLPIPFIELDGYQVIENPVNWKPTLDYFKPLTCDQCKSSYEKFRDKVKQIANACRVSLPTTYYRYGYCRCWKCKREIIAFAWPKDRMHDGDAPQALPRPRTIRYRYSKTAASKYWVNTCPYCQSILGDFFLYQEPAGPFFTANIEEDSAAAFDQDMIRIAEHAARSWSL
jgi:hypothetical protein